MSDQTTAEIVNGVASSIETFKKSQDARMSALETRLNRPGAFHAPLDGNQKLDDTERKAFGELLRTGDRRHAVEAKAAVNVGTSGQGMETVATWFDSIVLSMARDYAPLLKLVRTTAVGNFPVKHIVTNSRVMGSGWVGEQGTRSDTDAPLPLVVEVPAGEWFALPSVTEWALTDANFDVESWLRAELVSEYAETLQAAIVAGNGTNKPTGFLAGPTPVVTADAARAFGTLQYIPTGAASALATNGVDYFTDVVASLAWKHRQNASWVMNAQTQAVVRKYKDTTGRPLFVDSLITGQPSTLMGFPVYECEAMPSIAAGAFPIAFGDFNAGYVLDQDASGLKITRDEITSKGFIKYYSRRRCGGKVLDSEALKICKVSAT